MQPLRGNCVTYQWIRNRTCRTSAVSLGVNLISIREPHPPVLRHDPKNPHLPRYVQPESHSSQTKRPKQTKKITTAMFAKKQKKPQNKILRKRRVNTTERVSFCLGWGTVCTQSHETKDVLSRARQFPKPKEYQERKSKKVLEVRKKKTKYREKRGTAGQSKR